MLALGLSYHDVVLAAVAVVSTLVCVFAAWRLLACAQRKRGGSQKSQGYRSLVDERERPQASSTPPPNTPPPPNALSRRRSSLGPTEKCVTILSSLASQAKSEEQRGSILFVLDTLMGRDKLQSLVDSDNDLENTTKEWIVREFSHGRDKIEPASPRARQSRRLSRVQSRTVLEKPEVRVLLTKLDSFVDFDVWELDRASGGHVLQTLGWSLLHKWGCVEEFNVNPKVLEAWLYRVESMYNDNPYHNRLHAADVLQAVHALLIMGMDKFFTPMEMFCLLVSAIIHDLDHDGRTNAFHTLTSSPRALQFNDRSVQENHHLVKAFTLTTQPETNIFAGMDKVNVRELRAMIVECVLATDMKEHSVHQRQLQVESEARGCDPANWPIEERGLLRAMTLHFADLSNPMRPVPFAKKWAEKVLEEFFQQGDSEKRIGLPVSPLCDRDTTNLPNSQIGFLQYVIMPFLKTFAVVLPALNGAVLPVAEENLRHWQAQKGS